MDSDTGYVPDIDTLPVPLLLSYSFWVIQLVNAFNFAIYILQGAAKVSILMIGQQAIMDAYLCLLHLTAGILVGKFKLSYGFQLPFCYL